MHNFKHKNILITGAGKGIGLQLAKDLDTAGAGLILHASSDSSINQLKKIFGTNKHIYFKADFTNAENLEQQWKEQINANTQLDAFVNCVGIRSRRPLNMLKPLHVIEVLTANVAAFIEMVRITTKKENCKTGMRIVSVSSIAGHSGAPGVTAYAASKAAMEAAVRCMAKELHKKEITINTVVCGQVNTEAYEELMANKDDGTDKVLDRQYMGLAPVTAITQIILFLLSNQSAYITGASIPADGGYLT